LPRLSEKQFAQLEAELAKGPAAHGWEDQCWTLGRIKTVIGRRRSQVSTMARSIASVIGGALRARFRLPHSLRYSASMPRSSAVPGFLSSGIQVRTPLMYVRIVFGAISRAMRLATHSTYVAVAQGRSTRPIGSAPLTKQAPLVGV
jgi:hypothetical protein